MLREYLCRMKRLLVIIGLFTATFGNGQTSCNMEEFIKRYEDISVEVYMDGPHIAIGYGHHIRFTEMEWVREV